MIVLHTGVTGDPSSPGSDVEEDDLAMTLSPQEIKHADIEAMTKEIKGMDEVWEILASVPWLDDSE